jgi:hypothetical protein
MMEAPIPFVVTVESPPDSLGRVRHTTEWIDPDDGEKRGQCGFGVVSAHTDRLIARGHWVEVSGSWCPSTVG